ncbi:MAG: peptidase domain-containing ABC transporter [Thermoflavifilum aggregans]|nr:peptidase domain-containing ABC transporter [Thermoflavifilum aggregans]
MRLRKQNRFKVFHQLDSTDCGPACLAMVAYHYGLHYTVAQLKKFCEVTRSGVSVRDILTGARAIDLQGDAYRVAVDYASQLPVPSILHWKQDHFVVLYRIQQTSRQTYYYIADPAYGKIRLDEEIFLKEWAGSSDTGVAMWFDPPGAEAYEKQKQLPRERKPYLILKPVWQYVKTHAHTYAGGLLLMGVITVCNWLMPLVFKRLIDVGIGHKAMDWVIALLLAQFGLFLGSFIADTISQYLFTRTNFHLSILLQHHFFQKLLRLPVQYFDTRLNMETLQRKGDLDTLQRFFTWHGIEVIFVLANIIVFSALLYYLYPLIFGLFWLFSILAIIWAALFLGKRRILEYALFLRQSDFGNYLYEFIMHMPEIKINVAQQSFIAKLIHHQEKLNDLRLRSLELNIGQLVGVSFFNKIKEIAAIALCAYLIVHNQMTIGALLSITYVMGQLNAPVSNLLGYLKETQDMQIANQRVNDVYLQPEEDQHKQSLPDDFCIEEIRVQHISFKYPGSFHPFVLHDIDFVIPRGQKIALVGETGSGKTTLLKLLLGYYEPQKGNIILDGVQTTNGVSSDVEYDLKEVIPDSWRRRCGVVMQDGVLFSGTILDNIAFGEEQPDMERVQYAAHVACIDQYIETLPMKYHTKVGNIGTTLSGGQRQRLLIARAVYRNQPFLFLDEATTYLDAQHEEIITERLRRYYAEKTVFVIAHRLSTVKDADQILVMRDGRIVERGTHEALVYEKGYYFTLVKNQLELGVG